MNRKYGWRPSLPDIRDYKFAAPRGVKLPAQFTLLPKSPPVYDQGGLGSCNSNAIAGAIEFDQRKQKIQEFVPSRLFIYYNARALEGTVKYDSGAYIRDGIKAVAKQGVCPETEWAYIEKKFAKKPPTPCYTHALQHTITKYEAVPQNLAKIKSALYTGSYVVFGFSVYEAFESDEVARTGILNLPTANEEFMGGHAVCLAGWNDTTKRFLVRNSWGATFGQAGWFTMPFDYVVNPDLASDFWVIYLTN